MTTQLKMGWILLAVTCFALALGACAPQPDVGAISTSAAQTVIAEVTLNAPPPTSTPLPATTTLTPTASPTATLIPTEMQVPTATEVPASATPTSKPPTLSPDQAILYYMVSKDDGGPVGCGDTAVWINTNRLRSGDIEQDVTTALGSLFGNHYQDYGTLYNGLYASNLHVDSVEFDTSDGKITVLLSGSYGRTDDRCDNSRSRAQVWSTIRQFEGIKTVYILLNGNLLGDILGN